MKVIAISQGDVALDSSAGRNGNDNNCAVIKRSGVELDRMSRDLRAFGKTNTEMSCGRSVGFSRPEIAHDEIPMSEGERDR